MKNFFLVLITLIFCTQISWAQKVGIGTSNPQGELHVTNIAPNPTIIFNGTGSNDLSVNASAYSGIGTTEFYVRVSNDGPNPELFQWSNDSITWSADLPMSTSAILLSNGVTISFGAVNGHIFGSTWSWDVLQSFPNGLIVKDGKVGIGTTSPSAKLEVAGQIKITGGAPGANKVLTSDANGLASWQANNLSGTTNNVIKFTSANTGGNSQLFDNGTSVAIGTTTPSASAILQLNSASKGVLFPQVSIDSLKDITSIPSPTNGLIVYNTTQPGVQNDMQRGYYYYKSTEGTWAKLSDNFSDNKWQDGGTLGIQLRDRTDGVEIMDNITGTSSNSLPKVKILKVVDSSSLNIKNNINVLTLTGVNRKPTAGWENRQKTSIIFENNYFTNDGASSGSANSVAISAYVQNSTALTSADSNGLAFYTFASPQNSITSDVPSLSIFRRNTAIGAYATDISNVTEGRLQITGISNGDQLSLRHPFNSALKWGLFVSSTDSSLNFYNNGNLRANIDRATGVYTALSDKRMKKDILPLSPVLSKLLNLQAYNYRYLDASPTDRKINGFMAQDLLADFPELVYQRYDRTIDKPLYTVDYSGFGVLAVKAIQEQQQIIVSQDERIKQLEADIEAIKKMLSAK